ncbi:MAG: hypothetical protein EBZ78_10280 [Verrucomicrobia bacterium]|nr:hypothetical protein [Verrucomicrobiota bacterium]
MGAKSIPEDTMTPAEYGFAVGRGIQDTYSNVLMGLREGRAQEELSLRQRAFLAEQERQKEDLSLRNRDMIMRENESKIRVRAANDTYDLNEAAAFAYPEIENQFSQLDLAAANDDLDSIKNARFKPIVLPQTGQGSFSRQTQDRLNAAKSMEFNAKREALLGQSSALARRRENLENLIDYSTYLGSVEAGGGDPLTGENSADAARMRQLAGETAEHADVLTRANQYSAKRKLDSSEKFQVARALGQARQAGAGNTKTKNKVDYFTGILESDRKERQSFADQQSGVNITDGSAQKSLQPYRSDIQNFLARREAIRRRALAMYSRNTENPQVESLVDDIFGEDEFYEVTFEYQDDSGSRKTVTKDYSAPELQSLENLLKRKNGRVIENKIIKRPFIPNPNKQKPAEVEGPTGANK